MARRSSGHRLHAHARAVQPAQSPAPGCVDDVVHVGELRRPAELAAGEVGDRRRGIEVARPARADVDLDLAAKSAARGVDNLTDGKAVPGAEVERAEAVVLP